MYSKIHFVLYSLNSICVASVKPRTSQTSTFVSLYKPGHCILDVVLLNVQRSLLCSPTESHSSSLGAQPILIVTLGTAFLPQEYRSFSGSHRVNQSVGPIKQTSARAAETWLCGSTSLLWASTAPGSTMDLAGRTAAAGGERGWGAAGLGGQQSRRVLQFIATKPLCERGAPYPST